MQITIDIPDSLHLSEAELRSELAGSFAVPKATRFSNKIASASAVPARSQEYTS